MLVISRKAKRGEDSLVILVGEERVRVVVLEILTSRVRLGVEASPAAKVLRGEKAESLPAPTPQEHVHGG